MPRTESSRRAGATVIGPFYGIVRDRARAGPGARSGRRPPYSCLPVGDVETARDDHGGTDPGPRVGDLAEEQEAKDARAHQLAVVEGADQRGLGVLVRLDDEIVGEPATTPRDKSSSQSTVFRGISQKNGTATVATMKAARIV